MTEPIANSMKWTSALSTRPSLEAAIAEVVEQAKESLQATPDLALVFISSAFTSEYARLMPLLQEYLPALPILGCGGGGVVGADRSGITQEVEGQPALSLTLASLPNVKVQTFYLGAEDLPDLDSPPDAWINQIGVPVTAQPHFILLADPFSSRINDLLQGLDFAYPGAVKVGGLASGGGGNAQTGLFCNYRLYRKGTVGVALSGDIVVETIVAQGCRPIGQPYWVTEGERNILFGLEEQPGADPSPYRSGARVSQKRTPLEVLQDLIQNLSDADRTLAQHSLFVGIAQNEFKQNLEQGDFLIRQLLGVDPRVGAIAIGDHIRPGQRIQFHLRDAQASAEDLETLLRRYRQQSRHSATGALMFSCLGRGEGLYGEPNYDSHLFSQYQPGVSLSGFFCNGEIGPVGGSTFLHGYTSVFGIYRQP
ncbi:FIST signal transduction protein [Leptothermofonsia sichuanensis]|uniref:FIST signal transduction protein n=1 Tax=Leptothermofonsia sichuanensis TaxID=2917832 RepID=UPI001CED5AEA|nr:FIST N-terminal domain-containing protein [Leptothermofonsia sichuanensis]